MKRRLKQWFCGVFNRHSARETIFQNNTNLLTKAPSVVSETCLRCRKRLQ